MGIATGSSRDVGKAVTTGIPEGQDQSEKGREKREEGKRGRKRGRGVNQWMMKGRWDGSPEAKGPDDDITRSANTTVCS